MTTLEQKVDLIMRWIASNDLYDQDNLREEIIDILKEEDTIVSVPTHKSMEDVINNLLLELGIPPHINGFRYIAYAIQLVLNNGFNYIDRVTKLLCPAVAKQFDTTPARVERGIRHAIERACDNGLIEHHERLFGNNVSAHTGKPTNTAFIATCVLEVERRMKG